MSFIFENNLLKFEFNESKDQVEIEGKIDQGHLIATFLIDLINEEKIQYSEKRKKQKFHRIEYKESKYSHLPEVTEIARKCNLCGPHLEPLTFVCLSKYREGQLKPQKEILDPDAAYQETYDNDAGIIGKPKHAH